VLGLCPPASRPRAPTRSAHRGDPERRPRSRCSGDRPAVRSGAGGGAGGRVSGGSGPVDVADLGLARESETLLDTAHAGRRAVASLAEKTGRSGAMVIVDVAHRYEQDGREVLTEQQTLIYRAAGGLTDLPTGDFVPSPSEGEWHEAVQLDPVDLFRFSAVT